MIDFDDYYAFSESALPGGFFGEETVSCPNCGASLKVVVEDPANVVRYGCPQCGEDFQIDWSA